MTNTIIFTGCRKNGKTIKLIEYAEKYNLILLTSSLSQAKSLLKTVKLYNEKNNIDNKTINVYFVTDDIINSMNPYRILQQIDYDGNVSYCSLKIGTNVCIDNIDLIDISSIEDRYDLNIVAATICINHLSFINKPKKINFFKKIFN